MPNRPGYLRGLSFSISAAIGLIALSGVAVINSMGLVTFIRHLGHRDVPLAQAIVDAALTRMRPVLMTARVGEGTRTPDIQIHSLKSESRNVNARKDVTETTPEPLAQTLARQLEKHPDLAHLVERWDTLPEAVRAGIVAMVKAASEG